MILHCYCLLLIASAKTQRGVCAPSANQKSHLATSSSCNRPASSSCTFLVPFNRFSLQVFRCASSSQLCCRRRRLTQSAPLGRSRQLSHSIIPPAPFNSSSSIRYLRPSAANCCTGERPTLSAPSAADSAEWPLTAAPLCRLCAVHLLPFPLRC